MKIAVMGAGAVGCYFGAMLAKGGHAVTLIARPQHVAAIQAQGLILETAKGREIVKLNATTEACGIAGADVVLFCVKSTDTAAAGTAIAPHLKPETTILSLQNGVDNPERLSAVLGRPVVPVAVYVATDMPGPGHVRLHGRGDLAIGICPAGDAIEKEFTASGVPTKQSPNVADALWTKLVMNCCYNALSAVAQLPYGQIVPVQGVPDLMRDVIAEIRAVTGRLGINVPADVIDSVLALSRSMPAQYSSTAQDVARAKPSEIDYLNGHVVKKGEELGIPTPANRALWVMVKLAELKAGAGA